jgi:hypothetical protein
MRTKWYCSSDLICGRVPYSWLSCRGRGGRLDIEPKQELKQKNKSIHIPLPTPPHWTQGETVATVAAIEIAGEIGSGILGLDLDVGIGIDDLLEGVEGAVATVADIDIAGDGST